MSPRITCISSKQHQLHYLSHGRMNKLLQEGVRAASSACVQVKHGSGCWWQRGMETIPAKSTARDVGRFPPVLDRTLVRCAESRGVHAATVFCPQRRHFTPISLVEIPANMKSDETVKHTAITKWDDSKKYWMANSEYAGVVVGKEATGGDYVITNGVISPGGFVPDHYHKWEDQTFHVVTGELEAKIGDDLLTIGVGDTIHCPRGISHFIKNIGSDEAKLISYIFPGYWAEAFMAETSRQNHSGEIDLDLIRNKFGVVYLQ